MNTKNDIIIYVLTATYPFGTGETWLESEILFLLKKFKKVVIVPSNSLGKSRELPDNVILLDDFKKRFLGNTLHFFLNFKHIKILIAQMVFPGNILFIILQFWWALVAGAWFKRLENELLNSQNSKTIFYSQWFNGCATGLALLKEKYPNIKTIVRCHGWDVYEDRLNIKFYPFRKYTFAKIDKVFAISENGNEHLTLIYPLYKDKIETLKLGIKNNDLYCKRKENLTFKIVSCSSVSEVKRLHLIIYALEYFNNGEYTIEWSHFGDGELRNELEWLARKRLTTDNVKFKFYGMLTNKQIMEIYTNNYFDIFINVSSSEGIPVSIMEAQSFGIPVIATDVGGTNEIVNNQNGLLIEKDFKPYDLYINIVNAINNSTEWLNKRKFSRENWENNYNAELNYKRFVEKLNLL